MSGPIRIGDVRTRLAAEVADLGQAGVMQNAADFAKIVETNQVPQRPLSCFVMFGGLVGGAADAVTGLFRQAITDTVSIVLMKRVAGDPLGDKAQEDLTPLVRAVIEATCGWAPEDAIGIFVLVQAELVGAKGGALIYQIDIGLNDQLRIST